MGYLTPIPENHNHYLPIPGFPNHEITLEGVVRNRRTGRILSNFVRRSSTRYYVLCRLGRVHRLLMSALMGRTLERLEQVRHLDGNSYNNAIGNLRIGTAKDNAADRISDNTNGRKLRNQDVRDIRRLAAKLPRKELARLFPVTASAIGYILTGRRWGNLA